MCLSVFISCPANWNDLVGATGFIPIGDGLFAMLILFLDKMVEYHFILRFVRRSPMATRNVLTTFFSGDAADRFAAVS